MENKKPLVILRDVCKAYKRGSQTIPVLQDINLDILEGDFLALMGPSGSGKSTLLNLIAGIDKTDCGTITIGGVDITTLSETELAHWRGLHVGFIFQFYNLIPVLTAYENIELPLLLSDLSKKERRQHVEKALQIGEPHRQERSFPFRTLGWPAAEGSHRACSRHRPDDPRR